MHVPPLRELPKHRQRFLRGSRWSVSGKYKDVSRVGCGWVAWEMLELRGLPMSVSGTGTSVPVAATRSKSNT